ncbi:MAG: hypothetical protein KF748_01665 [Xanthobacteraceae bacterium]|nr:hypothetical protein [Xanthobacteraceae bacterium]
MQQSTQKSLFEMVKEASRKPVPDERFFDKSESETDLSDEMVHDAHVEGRSGQNSFQSLLRATIRE